MEKNSGDAPSDPALFLGEDWFDPIEAGIRGRVRGFIEALIEEELSEALGRARYQRSGEPDARGFPGCGRLSARTARAATARLVRAGADQRAASQAG